MRLKSIVSPMRIPLILVLAASLLACAAPAEEGGVVAPPIGEEEAAAPTTPDIVVSAETLYADYQSDPDAADLKYKGKLLEMTGEVTEIDTTGFGNPVLMFVMDDFQWSGVQATLKTSESKNAATISIGQTITIMGTGDGKVVWARTKKKRPRLVDCYIKN